LGLPEVDAADAKMLLSVVYNGFVEATLDELRRLIFLARDLCILIPISNELLQSLDIKLPPRPNIRMSLEAGGGGDRLHPRPPPPLKIKSVTSINGFVAAAASASHIPPPPPPPLKRVKTEMPTLKMSHQLFSSPCSPSDPNCIQTAPDSYTCALCNATYNNMGSFKQHMKFHEDERDREQRNLILNNMVSMCYSKCYYYPRERRI
jgi:hypothetical protein